jgi:hypothetical protein
MQSLSSRDSGGGRRVRVPCPRCGEPVELSRLRSHLRDAHQVVSADVESSFLTARRGARRSKRSVRR